MQQPDSGPRGGTRSRQGNLTPSPTYGHQAIFGGVFGTGRYALSRVPWQRRGTNAERFVVIDPSAGHVLSVAASQVGAVTAARDVLLAAQQIAQAEALERTRKEGQRDLWPAEAFTQPPVRERARPVSRRRRDIFTKCKGLCHYCGVPLRLDGAWNVEHMKPRALGGADDYMNLVAACVRCNVEKKDRTALEFVSLPYQQDPQTSIPP